MTVRCLLLVTTLFAAAAQQTQAPPISEREKKKQDSRLRKELTAPYSRWLDQDVAWIITPDERGAFLKLQTDDEREQFIEQFWLRRDPTPDTVENEFREEHYRRIAYANERFASGIPGWRTDRGRIYIAWGPPDERDEHASGGSYQRAQEEGGGATATYPFEIWRYRHLEGVDSDVNLEFVDPTMSGEYRLTIDPCEKDALTKVPTGAAPCDPSRMPQTAKNNQFSRLELLAKVFAPPSIRFDDLRAIVESSVSYNAVPLRVQVNYFPVTEASVLTFITVQVENKDLQFASRDGVQRATVNLAGKITTITRRPVIPFEATVAAETPDRMMSEFVRGRSVYNTSVPLAPGTYRLDIAAKDAVSGGLTHYETALTVPRLDPEKLQLSSVILTDVLEKVASRTVGAGQFVIGDLKVRPRLDAAFQRNERLGVYAKAYNAGPTARVDYEIVKTGTQEKLYSASEETHRSELTLAHSIDIHNLDPGPYTLILKIATPTKTATASTNFTVR